MKIKIVPDQETTKDMHQYLLGSVSPRPIALVSTIDENGIANLAPYSFFNAFSSNPPIVVFSSNRRVSDNTTKDTLHNIKKNGECVINAVNHSIIRQMSLTSVELDSGSSEFELSGLTPIPSEIVGPPRVKQSPVNMECTIRDIITLGSHGGAGHLIICDIKMMHIDSAVIDNDRINPHKIDLVGRMGRSFYVRASGNALLTLYQNVNDSPIGYTKLPEIARKSNVLSGNDLGELAALTNFPSKGLIQKMRTDKDSAEQSAKKLILKGEVLNALAVLMSVE